MSPDKKEKFANAILMLRKIVEKYDTGGGEFIQWKLAISYLTSLTESTTDSEVEFFTKKAISTLLQGASHKARAGKKDIAGIVVSMTHEIFFENLDWKTAII